MRTLLVVGLLCFLGSCKKYNSISGCINTKVDEFSRSEFLCSDASVKEYDLDGKLVYVFDAGSCIADGGADVYDLNCNYLGILGGVTGNRKIDGVEFSNAARYKGTVWRNH